VQRPGGDRQSEKHSRGSALMVEDAEGLTGITYQQVSKLVEALGRSVRLPREALWCRMAQRLARNAIAVAIQSGKPARRQVMPSLLARHHLAAVSLRAAGARGVLNGRGLSRLLTAVTPFPGRHPLWAYSVAIEQNS
jgi:hypothetical protein